MGLTEPAAIQDSVQDLSKIEVYAGSDKEVLYPETTRMAKGVHCLSPAGWMLICPNRCNPESEFGLILNSSNWFRFWDCLSTPFAGCPTWYGIWWKSVQQDLALPLHNLFFLVLRQILFFQRYCLQRMASHIWFRWYHVLTMIKDLDLVPMFLGCPSHPQTKPPCFHVVLSLRAIDRDWHWKASLSRMTISIIADQAQDPLQYLP